VINILVARTDSAPSMDHPSVQLPRSFPRTPNSATPRIFWTTARDETLRKNYPVLGPTPTASLLGTSRRSVVNRAHRLGLKALPEGPGQSQIPAQVLVPGGETPGPDPPRLLPLLLNPRRKNHPRHSQLARPAEAWPRRASGMPDADPASERRGEQISGHERVGELSTVYPRHHTGNPPLGDNRAPQSPVDLVEPRKWRVMRHFRRLVT